jgi:hypothetical protein
MLSGVCCHARYMLLSVQASHVHTAAAIATTNASYYCSVNVQSVIMTESLHMCATQRPHYMAVA